MQQKTYPWAVNALSVKAAGRFQLPLLDTLPTAGMTPGGDAEGMGWKSAVSAGDYDLQDGELYFDSWQKAVLAYDSDAGWTAVWQPERTKLISSNITWNTGDEKNLVYGGSTSITVTLDTTLADIAVGTTVRIAYHVSGTPLAAISVSCGQPANVVVGPNTGRTFVFYKDGSNGRWLAS
ncbi:MAG: hypothetical protein JST30_17190 [Armatimonadetes bacterium]|nr:hypothetical protein [Armatimonadota bacterium]